MRKEYLRPTRVIDCDSEAVREEAQRLAEGTSEIPGRAKRLYYFVRDEIEYNPYLFNLDEEKLRASRTLERREGFCIQKAVLLAAMGRAIEIPTRLRFADIRNHLIPENLSKLIDTDLLIHGYDELYIEGKWVQVTPTFDLGTCEKNRIIPIEFDGVNHAKFHPHKVDGELHIEYVRDYGSYADLPLDELRESALKYYGDGLLGEGRLDSFTE